MNTEFYNKHKKKSLLALLLLLRKRHIAAVAVLIVVTVASVTFVPVATYMKIPGVKQVLTALGVKTGDKFSLDSNLFKATASHEQASPILSRSAVYTGSSLDLIKSDLQQLEKENARLTIVSRDAKGIITPEESDDGAGAGPVPLASAQEKVPATIGESDESEDEVPLEPGGSGKTQKLVMGEGDIEAVGTEDENSVNDVLITTARTVPDLKETPFGRAKQGKISGFGWANQNRGKRTSGTKKGFATNSQLSHLVWAYLSSGFASASNAATTAKYNAGAAFDGTQIQSSAGLGVSPGAPLSGSDPTTLTAEILDTAIGSAQQDIENIKTCLQKNSALSVEISSAMKTFEFAYYSAIFKQPIDPNHLPPLTPKKDVPSKCSPPLGISNFTGNFFSTDAERLEWNTGWVITATACQALKGKLIQLAVSCGEDADAYMSIDCVAEYMAPDHFLIGKKSTFDCMQAFAAHISGLISSNFAHLTPGFVKNIVPQKFNEQLQTRQQEMDTKYGNYWKHSWDKDTDFPDFGDDFSGGG